MEFNSSEIGAGQRDDQWACARQIEQTQVGHHVTQTNSTLEPINMMEEMEELQVEPNQRQDYHHFHVDLKASGRKEEQRRPISSVLIFFIATILINLSPFEDETAKRSIYEITTNNNNNCSSQLDGAKQNQNGHSLIMFCEAKMLVKMAKMIYIKKKIKKLNKKLKKHTIAVPVITAIPIYEHSYYPAPHVTQLTHQGGVAGGGPGAYGGAYHAAASHYAPAYTHASSSGRASDSSNSPNDSLAANNYATGQSSNVTYGDFASSYQQQQLYQQELALASRNQDQLAAAYASNPRYTLPYYGVEQSTSAYQQHYHPSASSHSYPYSSHQAAYPHHSGSSHAQQIINAYAPSPPTFYGDQSAGIYGHYGNAYGRYDGGYHMW